MRSVPSVLALAAVGGMLSSVARADYEYLGGDAGQLTYIAPNSTAVVELRVLATGASATELEQAEGLFSGAASLTPVQSWPTGQATWLLDQSDVLGNVVDFNDPYGPLVDPVGPDHAGFIVVRDPAASQGVLGEAYSEGRDILLARVVLHAGATLGEITTIAIEDYDPVSADTVSWDTTIVLDPFLERYEFRVRVVPNPQCLADLDGNGSRDSRDFIAFLHAFLADDPVADLNADMTVNAQDFIAFLNKYVAGC